MGRAENIIVFEDTVERCRDSQRLMESIRESCDSQVVVLESAEVPDGNAFLIPLVVAVISCVCHFYRPSHVVPPFQRVVFQGGDAVRDGSGQLRFHHTFLKIMIKGLELLVKV